MAEWKQNDSAHNYVLAEEDAGFFVSYLPGEDSTKTFFGDIGASDDMKDETALVKEGIFYILNGDWRPHYEEAYPDWHGCIKIFNDNKEKHVSSWSTVH